MAQKRQGDLVTAESPTTTTPFDVEAFIREKDQQTPGFAAAVEAELADLRLQERLREMRKGKKITQAQLARRMGMTQGAIAQMENAEPGAMAIRTLAKMATALGYALRIDFEPEGVPQPSTRQVRGRRVSAKKR